MAISITNITSPLTYLYKYVLPICFIPWDGFRSARASFPQNDPSSRAMLWFLLAAWCIMTPWVFWYALRLKRVNLDEKYLYVKNYLKEIQIPLSSVESLKQSAWPNMKHVTLRLKSKTEFGSKIVFIPRKTIETGDGKRLVIEELKRRIGD